MPLRNGLPTCEEVKKLDFVDYLATLGHHPQTTVGRNYWYSSPLPDRKDKTPSFKVDRPENIWYDHGIGKGGTIIDFGILFFHCSIVEFLAKFRSLEVLPHITTSATTTIHHTQAQKVHIRKVSSISSPALIYYLKERKIPFSLAIKYLKEIELSIVRTHVALGFKNNAGGYELRNRTMKVSSSPKDSTIIKNGANKLAVFEGWP